MESSVRIILTFIGVISLTVLAAVAPANASRSCLAVAGKPADPLLQRASLEPADTKALEAKLTYIGHSTFEIKSPDGIRIATDYNDYVRPAAIPDIATMNRAHDTHHTNFPDPRIAQVLRGWNPDGGKARHEVTVGDVRARNVATNIRGWDGGTARYGNSIFVFELADLCIAHLGHLHHTLNPDQLAELGQMDVVLVPVDGSYTLDLDGMIEVLKTLRAPLMIPMHYFSRFTLDRFLARVTADFAVRESPVNAVTLSRALLPRQPEVLVLPVR